DADDRFDRVAAIAQLLSQPADMYVERSRIAEIAVAPNIVKDLLACRNTADVPDQMFEQREFLTRKFNIFAAARNAHIVEIDDHTFVLVTRARVLFGAVKKRADSRDGLYLRKRFDDVIGRASFEPRYLVGFGSLCRQH